METTVDTTDAEFVRFYGVEAWNDWLRLQAHFDLGEGFAFLVLLLPGAVGAEICRRQLRQHLETKGKRLAELPCEWPEDARRLPDRLFAVQPEENLGGIWLGTVIPESDPEIQNWQQAWRQGLASLNQHRNPLRERFACPLVLVGASWLQTLLRETAPDLWSVRTGVVSVIPAFAPKPSTPNGTGLIESEPMTVITGEAAGDPDYVLEQAERLRDKPGLEPVRAHMLLRAGNGFYRHFRLSSAERCFFDAIELFSKSADNDFGLKKAWAGALVNLAATLSALGRREEALSKAQEALGIYKLLGPGDCLPDMAMAMNNLANMLSAAGRWQEALAQSQKAMQIYEQLSQTLPGAFLPNLAMALNNLAKVLGELGQREEALAKVQEAVRIWEKLGKDRPGEFLPDLATAFSNLAIMLGAMGRREEAFVKAGEALRIREQLAQDWPDAFLPSLAVSLHNFANALSEMGRRKEAVVKAQEATRIFKQLAQTKPDAILPNLAMSLNNLANMYSDLGEQGEALAQSRESVRICEQLAQSNAFLPHLAMSLNNLSKILSESGQREEALAKVQEALRIQQQLAQTWPDAFLPSLAMSLTNLANALSESGRAEEALAQAQAAVQVYEQLAQARPDAFLPNLAMSCGAHGMVLTGLGHHDEAVASFGKGLRALTPLFQKTPEIFANLVMRLCRDYLQAIKQAKMEPDMALLSPVMHIFEILKQSQPKV